MSNSSFASFCLLSKKPMVNFYQGLVFNLLVESCVNLLNPAIYFSRRCGKFRDSGQGMFNRSFSILIIKNHLCCGGKETKVMEYEEGMHERQNTEQAV